MRILLVLAGVFLLSGCTTSGGLWGLACPPKASCGSQCTVLDCL